jgi:TPP-dependent pyruvate/acetoin dehydrogenase alpha subunit
VLVTATTFRMGGHATHDEAEARANLQPALFQYWGERDPIGNYEHWLVESDIALEAGLATWGLSTDGLPAGRAERNHAALERVAAWAQAEVEAAAEDALRSRAEQMPNGSDVTADVFAEGDA